MTKAFVFGKFFPFHKGHEAMIYFAATKCDFLTVLICCSDKESIPDSVRRSWMEKAFEKEKNIEIKTFNYSESELPNTSESSESVSEIWAKKFKELFPDYTLLVTSEPYGSYVSKFMNIQHIAFDPGKKQYPVSSSSIRDDLFNSWNYLPSSVKQYFTIKVVILGTESTGKTVLTNRLANYYHCSFVSEVGRELIDNSNTFGFNDLIKVAEAHSKRIQQTITGDSHSPLVIIDTDVHITMSYSRFTFNRELEITKEIYDSNKADLYLYLNNDVEFIQDGTRLSEYDRNRLDLLHRQILKEHSICFIEIDGDWESRFNKAVKNINELIESKKAILISSN